MQQFNKTIKKIASFDYITKKDIKEHNPILLEIPDHLYRISIIGGSGSGNSNALLNLINHDSDVDKTFYILKIHMKKSLN